MISSLQLCFSRVCLAESMLEVTYILILLAATELGFEQGQSHIRVREEGWYMVVSLFTNLQRLWVLRGLAWRLARQDPATEGQDAPASVSMDSFSSWWCFFISLASSFWYCVQASQWMYDAWHFTIVSSLALVNLVICGGWILILRFGGRKAELGTLAVHVFHRDGGVNGQDNGEAASCVVCLLEFEQGEELGRLPCGHTFHRSCIESWLAVRAQCPMRCPGGHASEAQPQQSFGDATNHRPAAPALPRNTLPDADVTSAISSAALPQARGLHAAVRALRRQARQEGESVVGSSPSASSRGNLSREQRAQGQQRRHLEANSGENGVPDAVVMPDMVEEEMHLEEAEDDSVGEEVSMPQLTRPGLRAAPNHSFGGILSM